MRAAPAHEQLEADQSGRVGTQSRATRTYRMTTPSSSFCLCRPFISFLAVSLSRLPARLPSVLFRRLSSAVFEPSTTILSCYWLPALLLIVAPFSHCTLLYLRRSSPYYFRKFNNVVLFSLIAMPLTDEFFISVKYIQIRLHQQQQYIDQSTSKKSRSVWGPPQQEELVGMVGLYVGGMY